MSSESGRTVELRQLRYFVEACDRGSLSAAAKSLLVSQPALTRQIQILERECGVPLFDRVPSGVLPTASGKALYQHVVTMLRYADTARDAARDAGPVRETVEVGLVPGLPSPWLDRWIDAVRDSLPQAYLSLSDGSSNTHLQRLREGRLDIAFLHEPPPADLFQHRVLEESFGVAIDPSVDVPGDHDDTWPLEALDGLDVLVHSREQVPIGHDQLVAAAHHAGATPAVAFRQLHRERPRVPEGDRIDRGDPGRHQRCATAPGMDVATPDRSTADDANLDRPPTRRAHRGRRGRRHHHRRDRCDLTCLIVSAARARG
ncbi:LysR family transcriptional regulator [Rhodococcus jostii]|uniref:LysR family transcriptional regulator n=1 Tax=Rhodococcus jostii TaxID=132919 RepID=UPI003627DA7B